MVLLSKFLFATLSNCGEALNKETKVYFSFIVFTTTFIWKHLKGTRLITDPNGNNVKKALALYFFFRKN